MVIYLGAWLLGRNQNIETSHFLSTVSALTDVDYIAGTTTEATAGRAMFRSHTVWMHKIIYQ